MKNFNNILLTVIIFAATFTACKKDEATDTVTSVILNKTALTLEIGSTETLVAAVRPANLTDYIVTWASDNPAVATVSNGTVTAISAGTAIITAQSGNKTAACTVTVRTIEVTGIVLDKTELTLIIGATGTLTATVSPNNAADKSITWTSSNTNVATVDDNGAVTAISAGAATITAKAGNKTATCAVTVKTIEVTGIVLDKTAITFSNVGETETLTATVLPDNATDKTVTWVSSNPSVASVNSGNITAIADGTAIITATAGDKTATCSVTVKTIIEVTRIALCYSQLTLYIDATVTIVVFGVWPDNATDKSITWTSSNTNVATVDDNGAVTAISVGAATITAKAGNAIATCAVTVIPVIPEEGVVINGVTWATRNVDRPGTFAATPESFGMYYQWNRKVGWSSSNPLINSDGGTTWDTSVPSGTTWESANDPSPAGWRVPTSDEIKTLLNTAKVSNKWTTYNGVDGFMFTDKTTGKSVFFSFAHYRRHDDGAMLSPSGGLYWSSNSWGDNKALFLQCYQIYTYLDYLYRNNAFSVRCVRE